jgi:membrane protein YqaA with SNARE-associated domain
MMDVATYAGLLVSALASATLIPGQSEAVLVALLLAGHSPVALLAVATVGNVAGSIINWLMGRGVERFRDRRWFPVSPEGMTRAQRWYAKYGKWSLLLSWAPVIGDPLTLVAGVMRERFGVFLVLVTLAKSGRYLLLIVATLRIAG